MKWVLWVLTGTAVLGLGLHGMNQVSACGGCCSCSCYMPYRGMPGRSMGAMPAPAPNGGAMPGMAMPGMAMSGAKGKTAKTERFTLNVSGMHCDDCAEKVRKAIASAPGVKQVLVDYDRRDAVVIAEAGKFDEQAVRKAVQRAGYGAKTAK